MAHKVLLVEDDLDLGHLLKQYLEINHFEVHRVFNGQEARAMLEQQLYDILILDVMMPKEDGFTLAKKLTLQYPNIPFLFVTAKKMKEDVLKGLKLGADDYMIKPFDADELVYRIHNILRRTQRQVIQVPEHIQIGIFRFEPKNLLLISPRAQFALTEKESQLLSYLYQNRGSIIKRTDILNHLWKEADFFNGRSMDVFISRLRKHLSADPTIEIESVRGVGFNFKC
ncbi:MAG: response regulator transcription factor [Pedobacter sp.]|nr:response regulator transcription factor [Pedobacter sp.]MDQ8053736.1 response regulator transcription factor [Pedobacter sp.]